MRDLFSFPNPVNEVAARVVAAGVAVSAAFTLELSYFLGTGWLWLTAVLAYGFVARALTGPTLSPLGQFAVRIAAPRLAEPRPVPGPPKRFAQGMGAVLTVTATLFHFAFGWDGAAQAILVMVIAAATLEAVFAYCIGCKIFGYLMRTGLIPERICVECADITRRVPAAA